jgi:hypothetical protein
MKKDTKHPEIRRMLDTMSGAIAQTPSVPVRSVALVQQRCSKCGGAAKTFRDELSKREYALTAWCQGCQDAIFGSGL